MPIIKKDENIVTDVTEKKEDNTEEVIAKFKAQQKKIEPKTKAVEPKQEIKVEEVKVPEQVEEKTSAEMDAEMFQFAESVKYDGKAVFDWIRAYTDNDITKMVCGEFILKKLQHIKLCKL
jgi:hypothetical protein